MPETKKRRSPLRWDESFEDHFWGAFRRDQSGCLVWTGAVTSTGYGNVFKDGRARPVHRVAWEIMYGPIPDGLEVCHHCDNRVCGDPKHLFLGTQSDNMRDMVSKNRHYSRGRWSDCMRGHPLDDENTYVNPRGERLCRICRRERERLYRERVKLRASTR